MPELEINTASEYIHVRIDYMDAKEIVQRKYSQNSPSREQR